jgi:transcriptional antiterminator NusG
MAKKWYVIQTYSGFENRVRESLQQRIKEFGIAWRPSSARS